jgi:hypothetical protein
MLKGRDKRRKNVINNVEIYVIVLHTIIKVKLINNIAFIIGKV